MKKLLAVLIIVGASLGLAACGSSDSSSGAGRTMDVTGTWKVAAFTTASGSDSVFVANLKQDANGNVVGTSDDPSESMTGVVAGNTMVGVITSNGLKSDFSVSGNSSSLSGDFKTFFSSGYQIVGTVAMTRL